MKCQILTGLLTGLVVSISTGVINCQPSHAENKSLLLGIPIHPNVRLFAAAKVDLGVQVASELVAAEPTAKDFYAEGEDKYKKGDYPGAIEAYSQAIQLNPNNAQAYNERGNARYMLGDKQAALTDYDQALKIDPNYAPAYTNRGNARDDLGDKQGAIADYDKSLKINPNDANTHYNRGITRSRLGDKQGAIADFDQSLKNNPNNPSVYYNRGIARLSLGDKQSAIADLQKAADLFKQQGNTDIYEKILNRITEIQDTIKP